MKWLCLNKDESRKEFDEIQFDDKLLINVNSDYKKIRVEILEIVDKILKELNISNPYEINKLAYAFDYRFAVDIYILFQKYNMDKYNASNDNIWRYIQLKVIPDIVNYRWGKSEERFFENNRRIWIKSLWWYAFLAWRESKEETLRILSNNTTDTVIQLVERTGKYGYRVDVYKEILYKKFIYNITDQTIFRNIMELNTMRVKVIDPYLVDGGVEKYVDQLIIDARG